MAVEPVSLVLKATLNCYHLIQKIEEWISTAKENDEVCCDILRNVKLIRSILSDLEQAKQLINTVKTAISNLENKLIRCEEYIDLLKDRRLSRVRDFFQSGRIRRDLARLKAAINEAIQLMNTAMITQLLLHAQNVEIASQIDDLNNTPSRPRKPAITKRAETRVLMTWEEPKQNSSAVAFYQVQYRKRWQRKWSNCDCVPSTILKQIVTGLSTNTKYWFRVRATTAKHYDSLGSEEITAKTKVSRVARGFASAGGFFAGMIGAPIVGVAAHYIVGGIIIHETLLEDASEEEKEAPIGSDALIASGSATVLAAPLLIPISILYAPVMGVYTAWFVNTVLEPDEF